MSPTRTTRAPKQAGFYTTQFLDLLQKSGSTSWTYSKIDKILHSRQQNGPVHGFPFTSNPETTIKPADQEFSSYIPGLNRVLFVALVVSSVVVLSLAVFIPICWRLRRRNRQMRRKTPSAEENLGLPGLGEEDPPKQIYDAPRPDSTTLPIQGILMRIPVRWETIESLGDMSNNFNAATSTKPTWSRPLNQQNRALNPAPPPPAVLRFSTIASLNTNPVRDFRLPTISSGPRPIVQSPTIVSLASNSPPVSAVINEKQPAGNMHSQVGFIINESSGRNKLRKKTRPELEQISEPKPIAPLSRISTFGGFGRASAGSMSNYWATWWESSGDEEEGDPIMKINKRRL